MTRAALLLSVFCVIPACSSQPDDPQGTYHIALSRRAPRFIPGQAPVPSTVSWPETGEVTLRFDPADHAQIELLGAQASVAMQVVADGSYPFSPPVADGSLYVAVNSQFHVQVADVAACPEGRNHFGAYVELFFLDGHVRGQILDLVNCFFAGGDYTYEAFTLDVAGDRGSR